MRKPGVAGHPRALVALVAALLAVVVTACGGGGGTGPSPDVTTSAAPPAASIKINPADGAGGVAVTDKVVVTANAPLDEVTVARSASASQKTDAGELPGEFSADRKTWTSTGGLFADSQYQVTASTAAADEVTGTTDSQATFTTGVPDKPFKVSWEPVEGQVVGVGTPIVLTFSGPTSDRAAVQSRLSVTTNPPLEGSWSWLTDRVVRWRPKDYYPTGTKVHVEANLAGLEAGNGLVGVKDRVMDFTIGAQQVSYVDLATHQMQVYRDGQLLRTMPISGGKGGKRTFLTMDGPHNVLGKADLVIMDSATVGIPKGDPDYYYEEVPFAVQYTSGGQYVHSAPWSVPSQGRANVSHGCVNASPADAEWFYHFSQVGDVINVRNSGRPPETDQLGNDWAIPWETWVAGSALPQAPATADAGSVAAPASPGAATGLPGA
ncbi:L,D-transpeptidase [Frankia nepalensis]|nr:Ig-like domain-containing protein [Frankia nepalensis]